MPERLRGWVYHWHYDDGPHGWFAIIADAAPGEGSIIDDLGVFPTHAEAIAAVCDELEARDA